MGLRKDEKIDAIILIDGEKVEDQLVWKGLTQTMKKTFVGVLDETEDKIIKKLKEAKEANDATRREII